MTLALFLYLVAFALFVAAAFGVPVRRVALGWFGMALWLFTWQILPTIN